MYADHKEDRPSLEEQYLLATNTSDLTLDADRTCAATHIIAAGLTGHYIGVALDHLRGEWGTADKPRRASDAEIATRAAELALQVAKEHGIPRDKVVPDVARARKEAVTSYASRLRRVAHGLRAWRPTLDLITQAAPAQGFDPDLLSPTLYHWLHPTCPLCDGHGKLKMAHAPALGKTCYHCAGSGKWPRPLGGYEVHAWLNRCAKVANSGRGQKMPTARHLQSVFGKSR